VVEDIDIWRAAHVLVREHGDNATHHAAMQVARMAVKHDARGEAVWTRIYDIVNDMLRGRRASDAVH